MKRLVIAIFLLSLIPASVLAQSDAPRAWGYGFGGIGGTSGSFGTPTAQFGAGAEGLFLKGLGAGAEISYVTRTDGSHGFGLVSTNVTYHFVKHGSSRKLVPFVTGGPSFAFGGAIGGNFGGGVQYWMKDRVGLRLEFREHVFSSDSPFMHGFRVGLSFR